MFKNAFMSETVLKSVVSCKGSDNLWLELFRKKVHAFIIILSTAQDLYSFDNIYIGQNKIFTHTIKSSVFVWGFVQFIRLMNDTFEKKNHLARYYTTILILSIKKGSATVQ